MEHPLHHATTRREMRVRALFGVALLVIVTPAGAGEKLAMRVSPAYSYEPASLTIQLSIEPDAENRLVRVTAESAQFLRSSDLALDGDRAPRTNMIWYRGLPAGDYDVRSLLLGARGEERATVSQALSVLGTGGR
jgi:hypothetical protein